jgi:surfeit locus 1 family protein
MTSERPRLPVGLTFGVAIVFAVCCALGVWQLQRAAWKTHELARLTAMKAGPPVPIEPVLRRARSGADVTFKRVTATCLPDTASIADTRMIADNGEWIARAMSYCDLPDAGYKGVFVDRGFVEASRGSTTAPRVVLPAPVNVVGVLSHVRGDCFGRDGCSYRFGNLNETAPYVLVAERETPAPPGVTPAPYPDPADNLQYVGAYAPTWFGLAGALVAIYAAMLWRRYHPKR